MQIKVNIEKRYVYLILATVVFLAGVIVVVATTYLNIPTNFIGHIADNVWVDTPVAGEMTLQQAIDDGELATVPSDFTTCTELVRTTPLGKTSWIEIGVPTKCRNRPCKIVFQTYKRTGAVNDIRFGDYYQAEDEINPTTDKWEAYIDLSRRNGVNGDTSETDIVGNNGNTLTDDRNNVENDRYKWSYRDDSTSYGMILQTCNY